MYIFNKCRKIKYFKNVTKIKRLLRMTRHSQSEKSDNQNLELQGQRHMLLTV